MSGIQADDWRIGSLHRAGLAWQSAWFSFNDSMQDKAWTEQLAALGEPRAPLFVLGFWRSGTTFLHELLCCDEQFGYPTTAQCMNPSTMLVGKAPGQSPQASVARPMDGLTISTDSPQEDEFALLALGLPSAYQILLRPDDVDGALRALDPDQWSESERKAWTEGFKRFVRRIRLREQRTLIFKSPTHTFRAPLLRAVWPDARFVTIIRDPVDVWHSNLRLWRLLCEDYAYTRRKDEDIERFVAQSYRLLLRKLAATQQLLGQESIVCRFEQLAAHPIAELERIYAALGLQVTSPTREAWQGYLRQRSRHRPRDYETPPSERARILERMGVTDDNRRP